MPSPRRLLSNASRLRPPFLVLLQLALLSTGAVLTITRPVHAENQKWALLIGIDQYKDSAHINSLGSAANDARALKKTLVEAEGVPETNIHLLVSDADPKDEGEIKPRRGAILRELAFLAKNVQPGDTVFVFFSGHGIDKNDVSYLLPYDADAYDENTLTENAIETTKLRDRLREVHAGLLVLAFDMCRNNPIKGSRGVGTVAGDGNVLSQAQVRGLDFTALAAVNPTAPPQQRAGSSAVVTLFSCSPNERSYEWIDKHRGYFSYYLEQGLRGAKAATDKDGTVHIDTLSKYVEQSVSEAVKREEGKAQTPLVEVTGSAEASHISLTGNSGNETALVASTNIPAHAVLATDRHAYLQLALTPADAKVLIDGVRQYPIAGRVAVNLASEASKAVEVGVEAKGFQTHVEKMTLIHGTIMPLTINLAAVPGYVRPAVEATTHVKSFVISATQPTIAAEEVLARPKINAPSVIGIAPGTPFLWTLPISGEQTIQYSASGLPSGLSIDQRTGTISGTIMSPSEATVHIRAVNSIGSDEKTVHLVAGANLALTPPMGWNSWDCFGQSVTEAEVLANARYIAKNMRPYGWDTIVIDYGWFDPDVSQRPYNTGAGVAARMTVDGAGRFLPAPNRFPSAAVTSGFKGLADQIHAMGLKFGIHIIRGIPRSAVQANLPIAGSPYRASDAANTSDTIGWAPVVYGVRGNAAAGKAYYDSLFRLYASWGVDFVKMDDTSVPYRADEIEAVHSAILKCGRSIVYSLSPGETPIGNASHVISHANLWRVSKDFWDNWKQLDHEFEPAMRWQPFVGPGHWPDADMLPVGHILVAQRSNGRDRQTSFTRAEQMTLMSLWCLLPSPLFVGANLPDNDPWTLALLTNPEVLAIDQDANGNAAFRVSQDAEREVWARTLADGSKAVGLFNRGDTDDTITASWSDLGISGSQSVRDVWQHKDLGVFEEKVAATIAPHGCLLVVLRPSP